MKIRTPIISILPISVLILALAACETTQSGQMLTQEPANGKLRYMSVVYVDDHSCPNGQVKKITGGNGSTVLRQKECVARPN